MLKRSLALVFAMLLTLGFATVGLAAGGPDNEVGVGVRNEGKNCEITPRESFVYLQAISGVDEEVVKHGAINTNARCNWTGYEVDMSIENVRTPDRVVAEAFLKNFYVRVNPDGMGTYMEGQMNVDYEDEFLKFTSTETLHENPTTIFSTDGAGWVRTSYDLKFTPDEMLKPGNYGLKIVYDAIPNG